ncbi:hypothetical protein JRO89_XS12G0002600 [Xanthoceras sorbifolium]|uniref:Disease resistance protein At4g27190-like leucine-rich repeats domain-containing protein n=1 Tax=Xanthoceras sorbifolium TaxID=99658 RepID=A0ABQ8HA83_9ROSI|nr:hypothetical protein JRO89_XS12G0002600 [Xanthoceras sorbifolium]
MLLTSRNLHVLSNDMNTQRNFLVQNLLGQEPNNLFWKNVGNAAEKPEFQSIADKIVKKCAGSPIAIVTIANALKNKHLPVWKDALVRLTKSDLKYIKGMEANVYSAIELSYNFLESEEEKSIFLICALLDFPISIDFILVYAMAFSWFQDFETLEEGRNRVRASIDNLKASCLVSEINGLIKMHDIIHAVAVSIASENGMFNIQNVNCLREESGTKINQNSTAISLPFRSISELPQRLEYPNLRLFTLVTRNLWLPISDAFFERLKELRVLDLASFRFPSLPSSLCCLRNLQALKFTNCLFGDIAIIGELKNLVILSFDRSEIEKLPGEIGQLTRLRLQCLPQLSCFAFNVKMPVISQSSSTADMGFQEIVVEDDLPLFSQNLKGLLNLTRFGSGSSVEFPSLIALEIVGCPNLKTFFSGSMCADIVVSKEPQEIHLDNCGAAGHSFFDEKSMEEVIVSEEERITQMFPLLHELMLKDLPKLIRFCCYVRNFIELSSLSWLWIASCPNMETFICNSTNVDVPAKMESLEEMKSESEENLHTDIPLFDKKVRLPALKLLHVEQMDNLKTIWHNKQLIGFDSCKLECLGVVAFPNLEELSLDWNCIVKEIQNGKFVEYSCKLKVFEVLHATKGNAICPSCFLFTLPVLEKLDVIHGFFEDIFRCEGSGSKDGGCWEDDLNTTILKLFKDMVGFSGLQHLILSKFPHLKEVWNDQLPVRFFCSLKTLVMDDCVNWSSAISGNLLKCLNSLNKLVVRNCETLEEVFDLEELNANGNFKVLSQLSQFNLVNLSKLRHIWKENHPQGFSFRNLTLMKVDNCSSLGYLFTPSVVLGLEQLQKLEIVNCAMMEEIITMEREMDGSTDKITFLRLNSIILESLPNLTSFYSGSNTLECPSLTNIDIEDCPKMETFVFLNMKDLSFHSASLFNEKLKLKDLPELTRFCNFSGYLIELPSLLKLVIKKCPNMQTFVSDSACADMSAIEEPKEANTEETIYSFFDEKVAFPCLEELKMRELPELLHLWKEGSQHSIVFENLTNLDVSNCENLKALVPSSVSLQKLMTLTVQSCNGLMNLLTLSSAKTLVQLESLDIECCKLVEEIITDKEDEETKTAEGEIDVSIDKIAFRMLDSIILESLPSLKSFYSGSNTLECPSLKTISIKECPKMNTLVFPKDISIYSASFFSEQQLKLKDLQQLKRFCNFKGDSIELPSLSKLKIKNCPKMQTFASDFLCADMPAIEEPKEANTEETNYYFFDEKVIYVYSPFCFP